MRVVVYGSGCRSCKKLFENTKEAVKSKGVKVDLEYITDMMTIVDKGFMCMPVLEIDEKTIFEGRVATKEEIEELL